MSTFFPTLFLLSLVTASGAALTAAQSKMMRRDTAALHLAASGEMARVAAAEIPDGCDDVFLDGTEGVDGCGDLNLIDNDDQCREASVALKLSYGSTRHNAVVTGEEWEEIRVKGCFKFPCSDSDPAPGLCVFYNEREEDPKVLDSNATHRVSTGGLAGTPICHKHRYIKATEVNATATKAFASYCPAGYAAIDDEDGCRTSGICKAYREATQFRTGTLHESEKDTFPEGCFMHKDDGTASANFVFFNNKTAPSAAVGSPLCKASEAASPRDAGSS